MTLPYVKLTHKPSRYQLIEIYYGIHCEAIQEGNDGLLEIHPYKWVFHGKTFWQIIKVVNPDKKYIKCSWVKIPFGKNGN